MKKIFTDEFISWVSQAKQILEANDIPCFLKNEFLSVAGGEVPFFENWPELWIHNDSDFERAQSLIEPLRKSRKATHSDKQNLPEWTCQQCGENYDGNYALCWSCGHVLDQA